ncbi:hypothetical protein C8R44DRAFT_804872 [Mycena epipterygia]|nr:hypothetical protein C8R44DRAFT_804872 [Mycena epipterygia]
MVHGHAHNDHRAPPLRSDHPQGAVLSAWIPGGGLQHRGHAKFLFAVGTLFSVAGGVFQTMTQLGTSFGVTASTIAPNHVQQGATRNGADALASYHAAMWTGVAFGGLATLLVLVAFRGVGTIRKDNSHPTPALPLHPSDKDVGAGV